jgi:hypothetical protein
VKSLQLVRIQRPWSLDTFIFGYEQTVKFSNITESFTDPKDPAILAFGMGPDTGHTLGPTSDAMPKYCRIVKECRCNLLMSKFTDGYVVSLHYYAGTLNCVPWFVQNERD